MKNMGNSGIWEKGLGLGLVVCLTLTSSPPCLSPVSTIFLSKTPVHLCIKNASGIEACASFDLWASNLTYDHSQPVARALPGGWWLRWTTALFASGTTS